MADLFEVQIKESGRDGSPMAYIMGMVSFPDKRYPIPTGLQIGDFWKVEITGTNPRQTVHFFKFIKKVTETMRVYVFEGRWGTMWVWDKFSPIPKVIIPSPYEPPRSVEVEDGVWLADVSGYNYNTPTAVFLKKLLAAEEMLCEQEKIERNSNGGYLPHEIKEAWERADHQAGPGYRDFKSPEEIIEGKQDISDLAEFFFPIHQGDANTASSQSCCN